MCVCVGVGERVRPRGVGCLRQESSVHGVFRSSLHLAQEMSAAVVLQAAGEDLAAGLCH